MTSFKDHDCPLDGFDNTTGPEWWDVNEVWHHRNNYYIVKTGHSKEQFADTIYSGTQGQRWRIRNRALLHLWTVEDQVAWLDGATGGSCDFL